MLEITFNIRNIRESKELTQRELAELAGISCGYVSMLERNERIPTLYILALLARALNVKIQDLVNIKESGFRSNYKYF